MAPNAQPFRFLDLPRELQIQVYRQHLATDEVLIYYDQIRGKYRVSGAPSLAIERVCRQVFVDCRRVRQECITTRLDIWREGFITEHMRTFCEQGKFVWLRSHVRDLVINDSLVAVPGPNTTTHWSILLRDCPNLKSIVVHTGLEAEDTDDDSVEQQGSYENDSMTAMKQFMDGEVDDEFFSVLGQLKLIQLATRWEKTSSDKAVMIHITFTSVLRDDEPLYEAVGSKRMF